MRGFPKSMRYFLMISSFMVMTTNHLEATTCPTLNRDQVRTLCRWDALKSIPLLKIEAKKITIDGATLQNKHDSCREKDSVKQFLTKNATRTYVGKVSKDFKAPNDHSQVLCIYTIDNEAFGFSAEGVPHPDAAAKKGNPASPSAAPQKKHVIGWGYGDGLTADKGYKEVEIKPTEPSKPSRPSSGAPQRPQLPVPNNK